MKDDNEIHAWMFNTRKSGTRRVRKSSKRLSNTPNVKDIPNIQASRAHPYPYQPYPSSPRACLAKSTPCDGEGPLKLTQSSWSSSIQCDEERSHSSEQVSNKIHIIQWPPCSPYSSPRSTPSSTSALSPTVVASSIKNNGSIATTNHSLVGLIQQDLALSRKNSISNESFISEVTKTSSNNIAPVPLLPSVQDLEIQVSHSVDHLLYHKSDQRSIHVQQQLGPNSSPCATYSRLDFQFDQIRQRIQRERQLATGL